MRAWPSCTTGLLCARSQEPSRRMTRYWAATSMPPNAASRRAASRGKARTVTRAAVPPSGYHTVKWGDTLWIVSQRYGVTVGDLRAWNGIPEGETLLETGQRLRVKS